MLTAAKTGNNYHLWWHPHNFGENVAENLKQLREIIDYFNVLKSKFGFESAAMGDFA